MRKLKIYLDTSVINFLFADDAPDYQKVTIDFFDNYIAEYDAFISEIVLLEIQKTPHAEKKKQLMQAIDHYQLKIYKPITDEIETLAGKNLFRPASLRSTSSKTPCILRTPPVTSSIFF